MVEQDYQIIVIGAVKVCMVSLLPHTKIFGKTLGRSRGLKVPIRVVKIGISKALTLLTVLLQTVAKSGKRCFVLWYNFQ